MPLPPYLPHKQSTVNNAGQIYLGKTFIGMNIEIWIDGYHIATDTVRTNCRLYVGREYEGKRAELYYLRDSESPK